MRIKTPLFFAAVSLLVACGSNNGGSSTAGSSAGSGSSSGSNGGSGSTSSAGSGSTGSNDTNGGNKTYELTGNDDVKGTVSGSLTGTVVNALVILSSTDKASAAPKVATLSFGADNGADKTVRLTPDVTSGGILASIQFTAVPKSGDTFVQSDASVCGVFNYGTDSTYYSFTAAQNCAGGAGDSPAGTMTLKLDSVSVKTTQNESDGSTTTFYSVSGSLDVVLPQLLGTGSVEMKLTF